MTDVLKPRRPEILIFLVAVYVAVALNLPFLRKHHDAIAPAALSD